jgi:predicted membrane metal-binding protein
MRTTLNQDTKPMRRLPDSSPRISPKLRFPILFFTAIDVSLLGLLLVILFTPLNPNTPVGNPLRSDYRPRTVESVTLLPAVPASTGHSAPVAPVRTAPAHRLTPATHRPSAIRTAVPTSSASVVAATTQPPQPTTDPTPSTPTPTGS